MNQLSIEIGSINRLVVLVPEQLRSEGRMARQIWQLAQIHQSNILLIARIETADQEMTARRHLVSLASLLEDIWHQVEIKVITAKDWSLALETVAHPGDFLICHKEQEVSNGFTRRQPLSALLQKQFNLPVYQLSGYCQKENRHRNWDHMKTAVMIGSFLVIIITFFLFQIRVDQLVKGTIGQIILILIVLLEYGLFWVLNDRAN